jgi:hypothetical protein
LDCFQQEKLSALCNSGVDASATEEGYLRLIDESGEDYLYPADYFLPVALPAAVAEQLAVPA